MPDAVDNERCTNEDAGSADGPDGKAVPMDVTPADRIARLQARARMMEAQARARRLARNRNGLLGDDERW